MSIYKFGITPSSRKAEAASEAPRCTRITKKEALRQIRELGLTLKTVDGEHRVAYRAMSAEQAEKKAYYTNDLDDAVATAIEMAAWRKKQIDKCIL